MEENQDFELKGRRAELREEIVADIHIHMSHMQEQRAEEKGLGVEL